MTAVCLPSALVWRTFKLIELVVTPGCRYAWCPNLTIIDTPGFILKARQGEADSTPDEILAMVKAQAAPPHRWCLGSAVDDVLLYMNKQLLCPL